MSDYDAHTALMKENAKLLLATGEVEQAATAQLEILKRDEMTSDVALMVEYMDGTKRAEFDISDKFIALFSYAPTVRRVNKRRKRDAAHA